MLPKLYLNCSAVSETALCRLAGFLNTGSVAVQRDSGSGSTPLIWAASIPIAAAAWSSPSSFSAISPPNEWPITIGRLGSDPMISAKCLVTSSMPWSAMLSGLALQSATVAPSPGQPGAIA